jgi:hypothetical protein
MVHVPLHQGGAFLLLPKGVQCFEHLGAVLGPNDWAVPVNQVFTATYLHAHPAHLLDDSWS